MTFRTPSKGKQAVGLLVIAALCIGVAAKAGGARAAGGAQKDAKDDIELFKGNWEVTKASKDGSDIPEEILKDIKVSFIGNSLMFVFQDVQKKATIKIDSTKKPKHIDLRFEGGEDDGYGIFELTGDTVKIHAAFTKDMRPKDFKGDAQLVIILKRPAADKGVKKETARQGVRRTSTFLTNAQDKSAAKSDKDVIQGTWLVESAIDDGLEWADEIRDMVRFHVSGDKLEIKLGELAMKGSYKVDEAKKPKTLDVTMESGEKIIGIYELMGDKVKFCLTLDEKGTQRPKEFTSTAGSGYKLVVLKRAKDEKKTEALISRRGGRNAVSYVEDQAAKADKDQEAFQGTWKIVAFTQGGNKKSDDELAMIKVIIKGDSISLDFEGMEEVKHGTLKLDSSKKPKQIDIMTEAGQKIDGIYELAGDTLKICGTEGGPRPKEYKSDAGSDTVLMELKRLVAKKVETKVPVKKSDLDRITGIWKLLKARGDGEDAPPDFVGPVRLTFDPDGTLNVEGTANNDKGTFKIDAEAIPRQITMSQEAKSEAIAGIYKFDGDKLVLCFAEISSGKDRPREFSADKGTKQIMFILEQLQTGKQMAKARSDAVEGAARRSSAKSLSKMGIAMHRHHDQHRVFPAHAIYSKDGKTPLLSWRVAILPFLDGQQALYQEFKLDEPWDSEHNKKLIAKMPKIYEPVGLGPKGEGLTCYQVFTGKDSVFDGPLQAKMPGSFKDGTSNTLLVVEAKNAVIWTKPEDLVLPKMGDQMPELGGMFNTGMNVLFCDAGVQWVRREIDPVTLRALVTPSGGEVVDRGKLNQPTVAMKKDAKK